MFLAAILERLSPYTMPYQDVKFDETEGYSAYKSRAVLGQFQTPGMVTWIFTHSGGVIKNERQAARVLLICSLIIFLVSAFLFWRVFGQHTLPKIPPANT